MGLSIGDGIIVVALAAVFLGFFYFQHRDRQRRLEIIHQERLAAMDKGIPLPELPMDPPMLPKPPDPLIQGIILLALGTGSMIALSLISSARTYWPMPLPLALIGLGQMLYYFLTVHREH